MVRSRAVRPWMLALAVVLAGVTGASVVFVAGSARHRADRAAIERWERSAIPLAARASTIVSEIPSLAVDPSANAARVRARFRELHALRRGLLDGPIADFLQATVADLLTGIGAAYLAVGSLQEFGDDQSVRTPDRLAGFDRQLQIARERFAAARAKHARLRCRARMPSCSEPVGY